MPKNTRRAKEKQLHAARMKLIRPYVAFNYDLRKPLSKSAKSKIKKYADEVSALTNRPFQVVRPRRADHLAAAQEFAQHEKRLPALKVAFVPTNGTEKFVLHYNKGGVKASNSKVEVTLIRLAVSGLLGDAAKYVQNKVRNNPARSYTIKAGKYEIPQAFDKERIGPAVARFVARYNNEEANNYFGNWLHGVSAYHFKEQDTLQSYLTAKQNAIKRAKRERRNAKKKEVRRRDMGG